jgi:ATP-dependent Clp protease ATP-binding subunit ClpB
MQDEYVSVEHLLLTFLDEPVSTGAGRVNKQFSRDRTASWPC